MYYLALNPVKNILNKNEAEVDYRRIRGEGHVRIKAEIGVIQLEAKESLRPPEARRFKELSATASGRRVALPTP